MVFLLAEWKLAERAALKTSNGQTSGESRRVGAGAGEAMEDGVWKARLERKSKSWGRGEEEQRPRRGHTQETQTLPEPWLRLLSLSLFSLSKSPLFSAPQTEPWEVAPVGTEAVAEGWARWEDPAFRERRLPCLLGRHGAQEGLGLGCSPRLPSQAASRDANEVISLSFT